MPNRKTGILNKGHWFAMNHREWWIWWETSGFENIPQVVAVIPTQWIHRRFVMWNNGCCGGGTGVSRILQMTWNRTPPCAYMEVSPMNRRHPRYRPETFRRRKDYGFLPSRSVDLGNLQSMLHTGFLMEQDVFQNEITVFIKTMLIFIQYTWIII